MRLTNLPLQVETLPIDFLAQWARMKSPVAPAGIRFPAFPASPEFLGSQWTAFLACRES
jgi:hypothetical protein